MPRVKRGKTKLKRRKKVLSQAKGYRFGRSKKEKEAKQAITRAGEHAFKHRRVKKRIARRNWNISISAGAKNLGISYSTLMGSLKKKNILIDRKILAELAEREPETFKRVVEKIKE